MGPEVLSFIWQHQLPFFLYWKCCCCCFCIMRGFCAITTSVRSKPDLQEKWDLLTIFSLERTYYFQFTVPSLKKLRSKWKDITFAFRELSVMQKSPSFFQHLPTPYFSTLSLSVPQQVSLTALSQIEISSFLLFYQGKERNCTCCDLREKKEKELCLFLSFSFCF